MTEPKLYGIERADGTLDINRTIEFLESYDDEDEFKLPRERVVEIVAVKKEHLAALEEVVRAADRMATHDRLFCTDESADALDDYRSKRAALGEIGGEG